MPDFLIVDSCLNFNGLQSFGASCRMTTGQEVEVPEVRFKDHLLSCCKALKANEKQIFDGESGKKVRGVD